MSTPRIPPVPFDELSDSQKQLFGYDKQPGRPYLNIFGTMLQNESLAKKWLVFANYILYKSGLSGRDREILILRIGYLCQSQYEWEQHRIIARGCDINDEEIESIKKGADAENWNDKEKALLTATDELFESSKIQDETWSVLLEHYDKKQLMDIVFTVGQYNMVSMALNTFGVPLDEFLEPDEDFFNQK